MVLCRNIKRKVQRLFVSGSGNRRRYQNKSYAHKHAGYLTPNQFFSSVYITAKSRRTATEPSTRGSRQRLVLKGRPARVPSANQRDEGGRDFHRHFGRAGGELSTWRKNQADAGRTSRGAMWVGPELAWELRPTQLEGFLMDHLLNSSQ